jgi:hypothetical protein
MQQTTDEKPFLHIPETVSEEARAFLRSLKDPALAPPFPDPTDLGGWRKVQAFVERDSLAWGAPIVSAMHQSLWSSISVASQH